MSPNAGVKRERGILAPGENQQEFLDEEAV